MTTSRRDTPTPKPGGYISADYLHLATGLKAREQRGEYFNSVNMVIVAGRRPA